MHILNICKEQHFHPEWDSVSEIELNQKAFPNKMDDSVTAITQQIILSTHYKC